MTTSPPPPRGRRRLTLYALGPKRGVVLRRWAFGRWHIITQAAGQDTLARVRVCACTVYAPVCISVYYSLVFAARGRLAEIDPIPQLFRFLGQIWLAEEWGVCERKLLLPKSLIYQSEPDLFRDS
jgi:hypothetical protein